MAKPPAHVENGNIGTDPSQVYGWDTDGNAPVRIKGNADGEISTISVALNILAANIRDKVISSDDIYIVLGQIRDAINQAPDYNEAVNARNVNVSNSPNVSTVSSLTNQVNIGNYSADMMVEDSSNSSWQMLRTLYN